jgi:hypothetical protein
LVLQPLRGRGLQPADEIGEGNRSGKPDREMHMVRHAADAVTLPVVMTGHRGEIGVKVRADIMC